MASPERDRTYMNEALALARQGRYGTSPNPTVGCVIVRDDKIVGRGFHTVAGAPHAEVAALDSARGSTQGACAYVTLEPCNHQGRTGPCTRALIEAGIARVVYAVADPNPAVAGGGATELRQAGIDVVGGVEQAAAAWLNRGFIHRARTGRPWVRIKVAMSLDNRTAMANGESQWITGEAARADVQRLRAESCAVLTGIGTILADDPSLNVRDAAIDMAGRQPRRIILDSHLRTPPTARMLALSGDTYVITRSDDADRASALERAGATVSRVESRCGGFPAVPLDETLCLLARLEVNHILVEAGSILTGAFLSADLFNELVLYVAPRLIGSQGRPGLNIESPSSLAETLQLGLYDLRRLDNDVAMSFTRYED
ncbi:MAG: bifunctional diaminohydroxyphosphoribosylaminopyrimidine deaminase/5-amino-6-(5-phosphoribosylamino)uracil reductase RibD [Gammaproteobacteria bacterium]